MIRDIPEKLHTFFVPQMEQLGLAETPARHGCLSTIDDERGSGTLWALALGEDCLFTYHDIHVNEPMILKEFPDDYLCIGSMTEQAVRFCPLAPVLCQERNTVSFSQAGGMVEFELRPEDNHRSFTLCLTPRFFEKLPGFADSEIEALVDYLKTCHTNAHPRLVADALESMGPALAQNPGGAYYCEGKLHEILAACLDDALGPASDEDSEENEELLITRETMAFIDAHYAENLTLKSLADELYIGRTKLCDAFRESSGICVAEYLRNKRLTEAAKLLTTSSLKVATIAREVGYAQQSSFTEAFRKHYGVSPTQYRAKHP